MTVKRLTAGIAIASLCLTFVPAPARGEDRVDLRAAIDRAAQKAAADQTIGRPAPTPRSTTAAQSVGGGGGSSMLIITLVTTAASLAATYFVVKEIRKQTDQTR